MANNNPGNFANDREKASEAGRKGGHNVAAEDRSFSRNPGLAAEAGRKGGEARGGSYDRDEDEGGNDGNFGHDRQRASEAGRKGGHLPR